MQSHPQTPLRRRDPARPADSRVEAAYQQLKRDIMEGVYTPRQHLVETDMAQVLGVSRTTLRAVLMRLQHEGLVETQPNRGAQVRAFSTEEAAKILQVRAVLEGLPRRLLPRK